MVGRASCSEAAFLSVVFLAGLALRLRLAYITHFNPDEALHAILSFGRWREVWEQSPHRGLHPPLLILITHLVSFASRTEIALRMVPVLAGSVFPVLVYIWLRRVAGTAAAMAAMFPLTLAPHLISISAQLAKLHAGPALSLRFAGGARGGRRGG